MAAPRKVTSIERELAEAFFKSCGAHLGLWDSVKKELRAGATSEALYQSNLQIITTRLAGAWTYDSLNKAIWAAHRKGLKCALLSEILPEDAEGEKLAEDANLIPTDSGCYHPALFDRLAPSFTVGDGQIMAVSRGKQTKKESFTLDDLMNYYYRVVKTGRVARRHTNYLGQMRYLLVGNRLDEILHAIDLAGDTDQDIRILDLERYMREAKERVRINMARSGE